MISKGLDKIGNAYINWIRHLVTILLTVTFIGSIYLATDILIKVNNSPKLSGDALVPGVSWNLLRDKVFPPKTEQTAGQTTSPQANTTQPQEPITLDPLFQDIINNFDKIFVIHGTRFEEYGFTATEFQETVSGAATNQGIGPEHKVHFLNGLKALSFSLTQEPNMVFLRDNPKLKFDKIIQAVTEYINTYSSQVEQLRAETELATTTSMQKKLEGTSKIPLLLYLLVSFVVTVLFLIVFKVELSLRKMVAEVKHLKNTGD